MTDHPLSPARRPRGRITRGKTAPNRLRRVDAFVLAWDAELLRRRSGPFRRAPWVDLGFGFEPRTTLESHERWRRVNPALAVIGVEIDRQRVERAQEHAGPGIDFRHGGFELPLGHYPDGEPERARLVRAFNVLRQYEAAEVGPAVARLARHVLPGGLLVEGTSDPPGRHWVSHVLRRTELDWAEVMTSGADEAGEVNLPWERLWQREALVFGTNFRGWQDGLDPTPFQAVLPKDLVHRVVPGEPIHAFIEAWKRAVLETRGVAAFGRRQHFVAAARRLAESPAGGSEHGFAVDPRRRWLRRGWMVCRRPKL